MWILRSLCVNYGCNNRQSSAGNYLVLEKKNKTKNIFSFPSQTRLARFVSRPNISTRIERYSLLLALFVCLSLQLIRHWQMNPLQTPALNQDWPKIAPFYFAENIFGARTQRLLWARTSFTQALSSSVLTEFLDEVKIICFDKRNRFKGKLM